MAIVDSPRLWLADSLDGQSGDDSSAGVGGVTHVVDRLRMWPHGLNTAKMAAMTRAVGEMIGG